MDLFSSDLTGILMITLSPVIGVLAVRFWLKRKGKNSVFQGSQDFEEVGFTLLQSLGNVATARRVGEGVEYVPTWGLRLGIPAITALAWLIYQNTNMDRLWAELGVTNPLVETFLLAALGLVVLHAWLWMAFFHRVKIEGDQISVVNEKFQTKRARLSDLRSVRVMEKRPLYEARFADGQKLVFSKFISNRAELLAVLEAAISGEAKPDLSNRRRPHKTVSEQSLVKRKGRMGDVFARRVH